MLSKLMFAVFVAALCLVRIDGAHGATVCQLRPQSIECVVDLHRICYLGHIGQPSKCVWVPTTPTRHGDD